MKFRNFIIIIFLIFFGIVHAILREQIIIKSNISGVDNDFFSFLINIDFIIGFIYPLFLFGGYVILFRMSHFIIFSSEIQDIQQIVAIGMIPNFIFNFLNFFYSVEMTSRELEYINLYKSEGIIPFVDYDTSVFISNLFYYLPGLCLFCYFIIIKEENLFNSFLISIFPMLVITLTYYLIQ